MTLPNTRHGGHIGQAGRHSSEVVVMYYFGTNSRDERIIIHASRLSAWERSQIEQLSRHERPFVMIEGHLIKQCFAVYQNPRFQASSLPLIRRL